MIPGTASNPETTMEICRCRIESIDKSCPVQRELGRTYRHLHERAERYASIRDCTVPAIKFFLCDDMLLLLDSWNPVVPDLDFRAHIEAERAEALQWLIEDAPKSRG